MPTITIKNRYTDAVVYSYEASDEQQASGLALRNALEAAVSSGANLRGAYLRGAYLRGADLRGADLRGADLCGAYLGGANLDGANLDGANLCGAYLRGAYLRGAYLRGANLDGAYLGSKKLLGNRPILMIGPIGSRSDYLTAYITDAGLMILAGCFFGSVAEFSAAITETHGDNEHGREYRAALAYIDAHAAIWTPTNAPC